MGSNCSTSKESIDHFESFICQCGHLSKEHIDSLMCAPYIKDIYEQCTCTQFKERIKNGQ